jgi:hypothetical protein
MTDDLFLRCVMRAAFDLPTPVREVDPGPSIAAIVSEAKPKPDRCDHHGRRAAARSLHTCNAADAALMRTH